MGLSYRKSISVGPFRFNISGSGIGVSTGIKGLRYGVGPRGHYVSSSFGGFSYRKTLSPRFKKNSTKPTEVKFEKSSISKDIQFIESGDVLNMIDSDRMDLLNDINQKLSILPYTKIWFYTSLLLLLTGIGLFTILLTPLVWWYENYKRAVLLVYELDQNSEMAFDSKLAAFHTLDSCSKLWFVDSYQGVEDIKRNAGASKLVDRSATKLSFAPPKFLKTNINLPTINFGKQTLIFLPDTLLVIEGKKAGAIPYDELKVSFYESQFIESSTPRDAKVIGRTYQYVNKKGGPDKRFKNNPQYDICLYKVIQFKSSSGLNEQLMLSNVGLGDLLVQELDSKEAA